jgi:protein gp37
MGKTTAISWCDHTFNPWIGCTKVSPGCANCYAETQNKRYNWNPEGWGPEKPRRRTSDTYWREPIKWAKKAACIERVFCSSLADVFDPEVPLEWQMQLFDLINQTGDCESLDVCGVGLEWLLLTKRPENIAAMIPDWWLAGPPPYVRIGVTAENQEMADKRIPELLKVWKGKNFVSYEPALGKINFLRAVCGNNICSQSISHQIRQISAIDWVITGGESGAGCRPMDLDWARSARDQCKVAGVPFFFKQVGGFPQKQDDPEAWPADLRIQEFPE